MSKTIVDDEVINLYRVCGISTTRPNIPRNTINTGNLNSYLNYDFHNMLSSDSAERLRWE